LVVLVAKIWSAFVNKPSWPLCCNLCVSVYLCVPCVCSIVSWVKPILSLFYCQQWCLLVLT